MSVAWLIHYITDASRYVIGLCCIWQWLQYEALSVWKPVQASSPGSSKIWYNKRHNFWSLEQLLLPSNIFWMRTLWLKTLWFRVCKCTKLWAGRQRGGLARPIILPRLWLSLGKMAQFETLHINHNIMIRALRSNKELGDHAETIHSPTLKTWAKAKRPSLDINNKKNENLLTSHTGLENLASCKPLHL